MKSLSFDSIDPIYNCEKKVAINWHSIKFPELRVFAFLLNRIIGTLGDSAKDDLWVNLIRKLKRFRFDLCAAPLSQEILEKQLFNLIEHLNAQENLCKTSYPDLFRDYTNLKTQLEVLSTSHLSVLLDSVSNLPGITYGNTVIVICEARLVEEVERSIYQIPQLRNVKVTVSSLLKDETCFHEIILVGPSRWYPAYILSSPRAHKIILLKYSWIKDNWRYSDTFVEPFKQKGRKFVRAILKNEEEDEDALSPDEILPPIFDFQKFAYKTASGVSSVGEELDYLVDARIFLLEAGWAVFLEADDSSKVTVIDLENDRSNPLIRIRISEVAPGMFILLRTGGGGDYVIPVADQIMGNEAFVAREFQKEWKKHLRERVKHLGYDKVIEKLTELGSERASYMNVHNWISERSIRTDNIEDFKAIMRLIGLDNHYEYYWNMMKLIDRAHLKAGMTIRKMLLEQVRCCDITDLKRIGKMEFTLPGKESVSITAFQVKDILPNVVSVPPWKLGNPFEPEE